MSWREAFVTSLGPGYFGGTTPRTWLRVLRENQFDVDWPYWPRALVITLGSFQNALLSGWENLVYARRVRARDNRFAAFCPRHLQKWHDLAP